MKRIILIFLCIITFILTGCNSNVDKFKKLPVVVLNKNGDPKIIMPVKDFAKIYVSAMEFSTYEHDFKWKVQEVENKGERIKSNKFYLLTYESNEHIIEFPIVINDEKKFDFCIGNNIRADRMDKVNTILYAPFTPAFF